jgi:uncharacterized protein YecT (DUF1311 family)
MRKTPLAAVAVVLSLSSAAAAQDAPLYAKKDCNAVIADARAFHQCFADNLAAADAALNALYKQLLRQKVFYVGSAAALRDTERAWVVYKEKECAYEYGAEPASEDYWLAHAGCEIRVTEQRIRELLGRPSCTGGDSLCTPHMR